jgi:DNA-binding protein H-NS
MSDLETVLTALESLDHAELQEVGRRAEELVKDRERGRQREAIEQARAIRAGAGLTVHDLMASGVRAAGAAKAKAKQAAARGQAGARYANPADPSQVYTPGRGRAPRWYGELKAKGQLPEPLP